MPSPPRRLARENLGHIVPRFQRLNPCPHRGASSCCLGAVGPAEITAMNLWSGKRWYSQSHERANIAATHGYSEIWIHENTIYIYISGECTLGGVAWRAIIYIRVGEFYSCHHMITWGGISIWKEKRKLVHCIARRVPRGIYQPYQNIRYSKYAVFTWICLRCLEKEKYPKWWFNGDLPW